MWTEHDVDGASEHDGYYTRHTACLQAHADVLVAASSGFSRLAAVLSSHVTVALETEKHPLDLQGILS